jgi:hypothetical protein
MLILSGVGDAEGLKLSGQQPSQLQLAGRTGVVFAIGLGGGVDLYVTQETLQKAMFVHVVAAPPGLPGFLLFPYLPRNGSLLVGYGDRRKKRGRETASG